MASGLTKALDLPAEIRSRVISGVNGLDMHVLEAGFNSSSKRLILFSLFNISLFFYLINISFS